MSRATPFFVQQTSPFLVQDEDASSPTSGLSSPSAYGASPRLAPPRFMTHAVLQRRRGLGLSGGSLGDHVVDAGGLRADDISRGRDGGTAPPGAGRTGDRFFLTGGGVPGTGGCSSYLDDQADPRQLIHQTTSSPSRAAAALERVPRDRSRSPPLLKDHLRGSFLSSASSLRLPLPPPRGGIPQNADDDNFLFSPENSKETRAVGLQFAPNARTATQKQNTATGVSYSSTTKRATVTGVGAQWRPPPQTGNPSRAAGGTTNGVVGVVGAQPPRMSIGGRMTYGLDDQSSLAVDGTFLHRVFLLMRVLVR